MKKIFEKEKKYMWAHTYTHTADEEEPKFSCCLSRHPWAEREDQAGHAQLEGG